MKLLIFGSRGWIGSQFVQILERSQIDYVEANSRVDDTVSVEEEIMSVLPSHVVCFVGRTHGSIGNKKFTTIDYLEQPGKLQENVRDNLYSPVSLALLCKDMNIHLTYLGTGCIFEYDELHPFGRELAGFDESSLPNFFGSSYSIVKGFTDRLMHQLDSHVLNLRIRMPIVGEQNPRNFITKITTYEKICSIPNSMTVLPELLPKVIDMISNSVTGTINLTNPGLVSHNEILEMFREIVDPEFSWFNFSDEEQRKILASGRSNNFLDTNKLVSMYPDVKHIKDSVRDMLVLYKESYTGSRPVTVGMVTAAAAAASPPPPSKSEVTSYGNHILAEEVGQVQTLFVTGGAGFIGSNFLNYFCKKYPMIPVINFDALYYCSDHDNVDKAIQESPTYSFVHGNLQSFDLVKYVFETNKITHVIHFAAQSHL